MYPISHNIMAGAGRQKRQGNILSEVIERQGELASGTVPADISCQLTVTSASVLCALCMLCGLACGV